MTALLLLVLTLIFAAEVQWVPIFALVAATASAVITGAFALRGSKDAGQVTAAANLRDDQAVALKEERAENKIIREQRNEAEARVAVMRAEIDELRRRLAKYEGVGDQTVV